MTTIFVKDLEENRELDKKSLANFLGGYSNPYGTGFSLDYYSDLCGGGMPTLPNIGSIYGRYMPSLPNVWNMMPTANSIYGLVPQSQVIGGMPGSGIFGIGSWIYD